MVNSSKALSISVVIATYNGEKYLREQLDSVFAQTYAILEIIAVDDCSSDATFAILEEYAKRYPLLKIHRNAENQKHNKTFERGIKMAQGDCVALCDQDDIWAADKLKIMMHAWDPESFLVHCDSEFIDANGKRLDKKISDIKNLESYASPVPFIIGNTVAGHACIFRKELIGFVLPFPTTIIHDWWLAFVAATIGPVQYVDQPLVRYRQHADNVIGAIKIKGGKKQKDKLNRLTNIRNRILLFHNASRQNSEEKRILKKLICSYGKFTLATNFARMSTFLKNKESMLATKKRSSFRKWVFCLKMFFTII